MQRTRFHDMPCPAARTLECVGEWWSILIIRDAFQGMTRFDEFVQSLGIAPNILTRRLKHLVDNGIFERRQYSERPPRYEYRLTERGRDFYPVLVALFTWGNTHLMPDGSAFELCDAHTGQPLDPVMVNRTNDKPVTPANTRLAPGPAANAEVLERIAHIKALHTNKASATVPFKSSKETSS